MDRPLRRYRVREFKVSVPAFVILTLIGVAIAAPVLAILSLMVF